MPRPGVLSVRGEEYGVAGTELWRLTRLVQRRIWRDEAADDIVLRTWGDRVVGVVSGSYVPVSHRNVVDALEEALGDGPFELHRFAGSWHNLRIILIDRARKAEVRVGDVSHGGLEITNSETGFGPLGVAGFLYRLVCSNGAVFPISIGKSRQPHCRDTRETLIAKLQGAAETAGGQIRNRLGALERMAEERADRRLRKQVRSWLRPLLSERAVEEIFDALPRRASAYDLYNGVTSRAQRRDLLHRRGLEAVGGSIVGLFASS